jgi:hypothetical protein
VSVASCERRSRSPNIAVSNWGGGRTAVSNWGGGRGREAGGGRPRRRRRARGQAMRRSPAGVVYWALAPFPLFFAPRMRSNGGWVPRYDVRPDGVGSQGPRGGVVPCRPRVWPRPARRTTTNCQMQHRRQAEQRLLLRDMQVRRHAVR